MPELYELDGPLLVLAGPGTGKTYALGRRVKYLVEERGVDPQQVCVITFTVPAAAEMRRRLSDHQRGLYVAPNLRPRICPCSPN